MQLSIYHKNKYNNNHTNKQNKINNWKEHVKKFLLIYNYHKHLLLFLKYT